MIIIVNNDEEEASAWAALDLIRHLRDTRPIPPLRESDAPYLNVTTTFANQRYL